MKIENCYLYIGEPYIAEKDGKYHVLQGNLTVDDVQRWYSTEHEAIRAWNARVRAIKNYENRTLIKSELTKEEKAKRAKELVMW